MSNRKHKLIVVGLLIAFSVLLTSGNVSAIPCPDGFDGGSIAQIERGSCANHMTGSPEPDDVEAANASDPSRGSKLDADCKEDGPDANTTALDSEDCEIISYIVTFTNVLSGVVGVVIVIMIAIGGLQYTMARDDPQAVSAAKTRIRNAILALIFYLFAFAFLQWIVPGGIF